MTSCILDITQKITIEKIENLYNSYEQEVSALVQRMTWGIDTVSLYGLSFVNISFFKGMLEILSESAPQILSNVPHSGFPWANSYNVAFYIFFHAISYV